MAENYGIDVTIDPRKAQQGAQVVDKELKKLQDTADRLSEALGQKITVDKSGRFRDSVGRFVSNATLAKHGVEGIGTAATKTEGRLGGLSGALRAVVTAAVVKEITSLADGVTEVRNKLRAVAQPGEDVARTFEHLREVAQDTRQSLAATATGYARLNALAGDLGLTQRDVLSFTKQLNQAVAVSGASSAEASAGIVQLTQGMASGALRGDELRSVLEQLPAVADVIAKGMGVTRGELRKLGEEGRLTTRDIIRSFNEASGELEEKFGRTVPTLSQSIQALKDDVAALTEEVGGVATAFVEAARLAVQGFREIGRAAKAVTFGVDAADAKGIELQLKAVEEEIRRREQATGSLRSFGEEVVAGVGGFGGFRSTARDKAGLDQDLDQLIDLQTDLRRRLEEIRKETEIYPEVRKKITEQLVGIQDEALKMGQAKALVDSFTKGVKEAADEKEQKAIIKAARDAAKELERQASALEKLREQFDPVLRAERELAEAQALLDLGMRRFGVSSEEANAVLEKLRRNLLDLKSVADEGSLDRIAAGLHRAGIGGEGEAIAARGKARDDDREFVDSLFRAQNADSVERLNRMFEEGALSFEDYERAMRQVADGMEKTRAELSALEEIGSGVFRGLGDAIQDFLRTSEFDFKQFTASILRMLAVISAQQLALSAFGGAAKGGNPFAAAFLGGLGVPGFATGGAFTVRGSGGTDSVPVLFRATPGEEVVIRTPEQKRQSESTMAPSFNVNVVNSFDPQAQLDAMASQDGGRTIRNQVGGNAQSRRLMQRRLRS